MVKETSVGASGAFCCALTLLGEGTLEAALAALSGEKAGVLGGLCPLSSQPFAPLTGRGSDNFHGKGAPQPIQRNLG